MRASVRVLWAAAGAPTASARPLALEGHARAHRVPPRGPAMAYGCVRSAGGLRGMRVRALPPIHPTSHREAARRSRGSESPTDVRASCSLAHSFRGPSVDVCVRSCLLARVLSARMHAFESHSRASGHARRARYGRAGLRGSVACLDGRFAACEFVGACGQLVGLLCHLRRAIAIRYSVPRVAFDRAHRSPHLHPH